MDHRQAIYELKELIPQMRAGQPPVEVLTKAAQARSWSPAQLEKVAFLFNTLRTVHFLDKSASGRGDSFDLLDVPALVDQYAEAAVQPKAAHAGSDWFESGMSKAAGAVVLDGGVPDTLHIGLEDEAWYKTATAELPETEDPMASYRAFKKAAAEKESRQRYGETLVEVCETIQEEVTADLRKLASRSQVWPEIVQDMRVVRPKIAAKVESVMVGYMTKLGRAHQLPAVPEQDSRRYATDRHQAAEIFAKIAEGLELLEVAEEELEQIKAATGAPAAPPPIVPPPVWGPPPTPTPTSPPGSGVTGGATGSAGSSQGAHGGTGHRGTSSGGSAGVATAPPADTEGEKERGEDDEAPPPPPPRSAEGLNLFKGVADSVSKLPAPFETERETLEGHQNQVDSFLRSIAPNRKVRQEYVDRGYQEARQQILLQRLLLQDPIISKSDPESVVALYESLRSLDPEMAANPEAAKLALREALQYDGMPAHTVTDLTTRRKNLAEAVSKERDVADKRYAKAPPSNK